jgi:hypothetical protein
MTRTDFTYLSPQIYFAKQHEPAIPAYTLANEPDRGKKRNELHPT